MVQRQKGYLMSIISTLKGECKFCVIPIMVISRRFVVQKFKLSLCVFLFFFNAQKYEYENYHYIFGKDEFVFPRI